MSSTTNLANLKYSIVILLSIISGMTIYIVQKNTAQNKVMATMLVDKTEKELTLKDLEFLKSKYDEVIEDNVDLTDEIFVERQKVIALIDEIKNKKSNTYYKKKLGDVKSKMLTLLDENYKLKQQKTVALSNKGEDTIYASYKKLYYQNKNLEKENLELANAVIRGSSLSISNFRVTSYKARNSGKLVATQTANKANYLKISYTINENLLSKSEEKVFYTQIVDPNNNVVGEIKSLAVQNELKYTFANRVEYNNKAVDINNSLPFGSFIKGKYYITIFDFNGVVGKSSFIMK